MAANIDANLANWSTTASSNQPDGSDTADLNAEFQQIQAVVRKYMAAKGSDLASASTVDLSAATGNYVHITGTTTITALGTVAAGLRYLIVFDGALTFTHNATSLILPGGANITTAAGDRCEVVSLGSGNWRCVWYAKANGKAVSETASASPGANSDITSLSGLTTPLSVAQGGTGAGTAGGARTELGVVPGADVMAYVAPGTSGNVLTSNGSTWESGSGGGLGVGQTWQNVTGSRVTSTTYQNNTGRSIVVYITAAGAIQPIVDGVNIGGIGYGSTTVGLSFIVPPGASYANNGSGVTTWFELR